MSKNGSIPVARFMCALIAILSLWLTTSCVHEFPESPGTMLLRLTIHHETDWTWYDYTDIKGQTKTRAAGVDSSVTVRYIFKFFVPGTTQCIDTQIFYSDDLTLSDFTVDLNAPIGESELRVFSDYVEAVTREELHHIADDFSAITLKTPYIGNTDTRDSFEGKLPLSIGRSYDESRVKEERIDLLRNTARVIFIATDTKEIEEDLSQIRILISYPLYMPYVYNMFLEKPVDARTGVSFEAPVTMLENGEAHIGMDYVFVNHAEAGVQMSLSMQTTRYEAQLTDIITVPLRRGRTTVVRGRFLTMRSSGGVGIDPDFDGDFDIEFR